MANNARNVVVVLPDIRSTHNTGSFFRTADGAGVSRIYLSGITAPPPHPHLVKVSLGAEESVPWEYVQDLQEVIDRLRAQEYQLVGIEQTDDSQDFREVDYAQNVAVFFGNEVEGLPESVCAQMDMVVHIPMHGTKESLNVSVCGGIILYQLL